MTPALLIPGALAALAALALPPILHIARRSEQRRTDFAALRWLRERPRPRHRLRFDEWLLLAVRLALLALLALWLARPVLFGSADERPWIVAIPGVARAQVSGTARARWLAPGFPEISAPPPEGMIPIASLLRELDAALPAATRLTVLAPATLEGADAERPRLSRAVDWHILPGAMAARGASPVAQAPLIVRYAPGEAGGARYLRAAALAWDGHGAADVAPAAAGVPAKARRLAWLVPGPLSGAVRAWVSNGGTALLPVDAELDPGPGMSVLWRDALGAPMVEARPLGAGRLLRFVRPIAPAAMPALLEADFPARLRTLFEAPALPPARVAAAEYRPVGGGLAPMRPQRDLRPWLALLIGLTALLERWLATARRRGVAP